MCPHGLDAPSCPDCQSASASAETLGETLVRSSAVDPAVAPRLEVAEGSRVGRFVVLGTLGRGGMGIVLSAYDPALDRRVAIKFLRTDVSESPGSDSGGTARLAREAQAMARLSHPNVVPVYDVGRVGDALFVAMEYVAGTTLHEWLKVRDRPWREVLALLLQAGRGLEAAHAAGIVHRDFKPANVLVGADGRARVTDFGLARAQGDDTPDGQRSTPRPTLTLETPLTIAGALMGTPGYMAPEQYEGRPTSTATDQYAFCVCLYEGLYGRRPFDDPDLKIVAARARAGAVPQPPKGSPVPPWVFDLVRRGLAPDPAGRFASMSELLRALELDPQRSRRRVIAGLGAGLLLVAAVVGLRVWPIVRASACHRETDELSQVWSEGPRTKAAAAFTSTGLPFASTALENTRSTLDRYVAQWAAERHLACDETLRTRRRTEAQLALRLECLSRRHTELATLAARFEAATPEIVLASTSAIAQLSPIAACGDLAILEARAQLDPLDRQVVERLAQQIAQGRILLALAENDRARPLLEGAVSSARLAKDPQTLATALLELAILEEQTSHYSEARAALEEALRFALEARDARGGLHAVALLVSIIGWRLAKPAEGLALMPVGRGLGAQAKDETLEALLDEGEGDARWRDTDRPGARAAYGLALAKLERVEGSASLNVARLRSAIGWVLAEEGQLSEARREIERSRQIREALLGAEHPFLSTTWNELGFLSEQLDDTADTVVAYRRVLALRRRTPGVAPLQILKSTLNLAKALVLDGKEAEASLLLNEVELELAKRTDPDDFARPMKRSIFRVRALLRFRAGDFAAAAEQGRRALEFDRPPDPAAMGVVRTEYASALARQGRVAEALTALDQARQELISGHADRAPEFCTLTVVRATALAASEPKTSRALEASLDAQATCERQEGNERAKAAAWTQLARVREARGELEAAEAAAQRARAILEAPPRR